LSSNSDGYSPQSIEKSDSIPLSLATNAQVRQAPRPHRVADRLSGPLYTHRIAISNARILGLDGDKVHVSYRDYRDGAHKTLVLQAAELLRRFLLHVLPKGLMRVRHYGLLANRCRVQRLAQIRKLLAAPPPAPEPEADHEPEPGWPCSVCRRGRMRPVREMPPRPAALGYASYR